MPARKRGRGGGGGSGSGSGGNGGVSSKGEKAASSSSTTAETLPTPSEPASAKGPLPSPPSSTPAPSHPSNQKQQAWVEGLDVPPGGYADPAAAERALQVAEAMVMEMDEGFRQSGRMSTLHSNPAAVVNGRFRRFLLSFLLPCVLIGGSLFIATSKTKSRSRNQNSNNNNNNTSISSISSSSISSSSSSSSSPGEEAPAALPEVVIPAYIEREALHYVQCVVANVTDSMIFFSDFLGGEPWKVTSARGATPSAVNFGNSNILLSEAIEPSTRNAGSPCRVVLRMARIATLEKLAVKLKEKLATRPHLKDRVACEALEASAMQHQSLRCHGPQQEIVEFSVFSSEASAAEIAARKAWSSRAADPRGRDLFE
mmetsp:Transcript_19699/g.42666  ORF Transcript_19699/g.42666 Transcript_19699/m.42666 type:complete len:371 (+) Transcript_19699:61-1173(+)